MNIGICRKCWWFKGIVRLANGHTNHTPPHEIMTDPWIDCRYAGYFDPQVARIVKCEAFRSIVSYPTGGTEPDVMHNGHHE